MIVEDRCKIEAVLFNSAKPVEIETLKRLIPNSTDKYIKELIKELRESYSSINSSIEIIEYGNTVSMVPKMIFLSDEISKTVPEDESLTKKEKEVLSFIAFFQPVSKEEIKEDLGKIGLSNLPKLELKGFIKSESDIYRTTDVFAKYFGVSNNPEEIQAKLAKLDKNE